MGSADNFLSKFGGMETLPDTNLLSAGAPTALAAFMGTFTPLTESYWFYDHTSELRYNKEDHVYFLVDPELGSLTELYGVTTVLKIIDRSAALTPWAAKMAIEKLLRIIPVVQDTSGASWIAPLSLIDFTKLALEAKGAHKEKLEEAGNIGHIAHQCLEDSIQHAIDHTYGIVLELRNIPTDEKAKACAEAGLAWMQAHHVRWIKTEQKIYSREYGYAGTMDGKALVSACNDPSCCDEQFKDALSIVDWKSSNALHIEYILQVAGAYRHAEQEEHGEDIKNCFVLRLGKNDEEAGRFEPWRIPAKDFPQALAGFLACLNLLKLVEEIKERMSTQKKGVREAKKLMKAAQKEIDKAAAKVKKEAEKAQKKLDRAAERERIKADAKKAREEAKHAKETNGTSSKDSSADLGRPKLDNEVSRQAEDASNAAVAPETVVKTASRPAQTAFEEPTVERRPFVIPEEG